MKLITLIFFFFISTVCLSQNFSNKGKEFWVGYGHNELFGSNQQEMVLYLSTEQAANVTVSINGTSWVRNYSIPANTAIPTDLIPKSGADDCRITSEGLFSRGIHILSDVPIVAYAHTYGSYSSGATMLLPVETYSYTYYSVNSEQDSHNSYSWFYIVASEANTTVRITPSRPTSGGQAQAVPFIVNLNKGEIYNVMGRINGNSSYDVTGSKIQSLPGADGICHPIGVFSGSSRTYICNGGDPFNSGSDYIMQQVFPINAWGLKYITAPTSKSTGASSYNPNKFRVYVRDANTLVRRNGALLTGLVNNTFYDFVSTTAGDVITATKPILMAQFIPSANGCGSTGLGDPEMFIISPVEQAINNIVFYNTDKQSISVNYLTMVIPQNGLSSLLIDGSNSFDHIYPHPNAPGYSVVIKELPLTPMQHTASSDSAFTSITYGLGQFESYGYNAGTNLRNLESSVQIKNIYGTGLNSYACAGTPFHPVFKTTYKPASILWKLSEISNLSPNADVLQINPEPTDSVTEFQRKLYIYQLPGNYTFSSVGTDTINVVLTDLLIENCSFSTNLKIPINVIEGPDVDFNTSSTNCENKIVLFDGISTNNISPTKWLWTFGDGSIDSVKTVSKIFTAAGNYNVNLTAVRTDGCINSVQKPLIVLPASFNSLTKVICEGETYNGHTTTGIYQDTLTAFNNCDSIITLNLIVNPKSFSSITQSICEGQIFEGYNVSGIYTDTFVSANGCDSIRTLNLTVNSTTYTSINEIICHGQSFLGYNATGIYIDTFLGSNGCDSIRTLDLLVHPFNGSNITHSICEGQNFLGYSATGIYTDIFIDGNGCDSIRTLNLTVNAKIQTNISQTICEGQSYEGYFSTGTYIDTFVGTNSCDSIRTLHLTVVQKKYSTVNQTICEGGNYLGYTTSGTYIDTFHSISGCDSIRTLNLTVNAKTQTNISQTICEGQSYLGYFSTGIYTDTFTGSNNCDSGRILHLTVNQKKYSTVNQTICESENYLGYTTSGTYIDTFHSISGCDSIRTLNLTVNAKIQTNISQTICEGQSYLGYFSTGIYTDTFIGSNNCDSVRILHLTVNQKKYSTVNQTICEGENYLGYTASGTYIDTFHAASGCDSIRTLNLTVNKLARTNISKEICEGQSFLGYSNAGTYVDVFTSANGCDSIRTLQLSVNPGLRTTIEKSICEGQSYLGYSTAGTYTDMFTSVAGCDSIRTLILKVMPKPVLELGADKELCAGEKFIIKPGVFSSYLWQDLSTKDNFVVTKSGIYSVTVTNQCGSATDRIKVDYKICEPYFPNAFTPNNDGNNDVFRILYNGNLNDYDLKIFNRYGSLIFHSNEISKGWDGTFKGLPAEMGNYIWIATFTRNHFLNNLKGSVILIR